MHMLLVAQTGVDAIAGGSGWLGAGLLGLVLGWLLLKHLPDKDKQMQEFLKAKDESINSVVRTFKEDSMVSRDEFKASLGMVLEHCTQETNRLVLAFKEEIAKIEERKSSTQASQH